MKFIRHLPEFGYEPIVITGPGAPRGRWTPRDASLLDEVPSDAQIARVPGPEPATGGARARLARFLAQESEHARWWREGAVEAGRSHGDVDVVYASLAPYESGPAAVELGRLLGRPSVVDLRDPWALDEMRVYPTRAHQLRDLSRMRSVLRDADAVVMNTEEARRAVLARFPELRTRRVVAIPNGFDAADYEHPQAPPRDGIFRIAHAGYLHTDLGRHHLRRRRMRRLLGGEVTPVDILTRSHVHLLEAVERVVRADRSLARLVEVHLAGVLSDGDRRFIESRDVTVRAHGYLSHREAVQLLRSSDLLFLPMHDLPAGRRARIVPGKTYEYLATGRPVLAGLPDGDARDILAGCESVFLCRPQDTDGMAAVVARELGQFRAAGRRPTVHRPAAERYERRRLTAELVSVLDAVLDEPRVARETNGRSRASGQARSRDRLGRAGRERA